MSEIKKIIVLGSKEFPMGINKKEDLISSGGIETYVQDFADLFKDSAAVELIIFTRRFKDKDKIEKYASGITVYYVPWVNLPILRNLVFNLFSFFKALRVKADYVFSFGVISTLFARGLGLLKRIPVISAPCGIAYTQPQYGRLIKTGLYVLEKIAYRNLDTIIYMSDAEKLNFVENVYKPAKDLVVPVGISKDMDTVPPAKDIVKIKGAKKSIIFLGRLNQVKRVDTIIKAVQMLDRADFIFFVVGSGPESENLKKMAEGSSNIVFLGFRKDVISILKATDIFVLASESEGSAISLVEAYSCGCTCVVSDIGLYAKDKEDALVFKVGNADDLKDKIEILLNDVHLCAQLGVNAEKIAHDEFSWDVAKKKYEGLFL